MATPPFAGVSGKKRAVMSKKQFLDMAPEFVTVKLGDLEIPARAKLFNSSAPKLADTGSVGFGYNGRMAFTVQRGKVLIGSINGTPLGSSDFHKGAGKKGNWLWHLGGKITLPDLKDENGLPIEFQVGVNITANKSGKMPASTFDKEQSMTCMVGINITAVGSGPNAKKDYEGWDEGGDLSGWIKTKDEEDEDEDEDEDEEEKDEDEDEEEDEKPAKKKLKKGKAKAK